MQTAYILQPCSCGAFYHHVWTSQERILRDRSFPLESSFLPVESLFASSMWVVGNVPGARQSFDPIYHDFILASRSLFGSDPSCEFKEHNGRYLSEGEIVVHLLARSPCGALLSPLDSLVQYALILQHQPGISWSVQLGFKEVLQQHCAAIHFLLVRSNDEPLRTYLITAFLPSS